MNDRSRPLLLALAAVCLAPTNLRAEPDDSRWSTEEAWSWYHRQPWLVGCNFLPSTAVNDVEMWQAESFDPETIDRELGWASSLGLNSVRVFLNYVVWDADPQGLKKRFNHFLHLADRHGVTVMPIVFDDCNFAGRVARAEAQPDPVPGVHNSQWVSSPPLSMVTNRASWTRLEDYVKDMVGTFGHDRRVVIWDLYNEPGMSALGNQSLPLVEATFAWAREAHPQQPLTMGVWGAPRELSERMLELSDIVSFHQYGTPADMEIALTRYAETGRPLLCTEWLRRQVGNSVPAILPLFARERVGCFHWGLVNGRTQTHFPWGSPEGAAEPAVWQHDLLHPDGTPYDPAEPALFRDLVGRLNPQLAPDAYRGWNSTRLANGLVEVQVIPDIGGRIIQYRLGDHDFFWVNDGLAGQVSPPSGLGPDGAWLNYGGDKLWPAPQGWDNDEQWPGPPDAVLDGQPYASEPLISGSGEVALRLTSREDPRSGIQFIRTVRLRTGSTRVIHDVTMKNIDSRPRRWGIWTVTQLSGVAQDGRGFNPELTAWCPTHPQSRFPNGYHILFGAPDNPTFGTKDNLFRLGYHYQVGKAVLDSPAGWAATVDGETGHVFVQRFTYEPSREYPDGASVEFWSSGVGILRIGDQEQRLEAGTADTPYLIESELISPFARLEPNETYGWRFEWASANVGGAYPVLDCSPFGLTAEPLKATFARGKLHLQGRFGVFQPGSVRIAFFDARGVELDVQARALAVSPLHAVVVDTAVVPAPEAQSVALRLHDAQGRRLVEMARMPLPKSDLQVVLPTAETSPVTWRYTLEPPVGSWHQPGFDDTTWREGAAPFGTHEPQHGRDPRTPWTSPEIWLRQTFHLPESVTGYPLLRVHHDDDTDVYLNGQPIARLSGYNAAYELFETEPGTASLLRLGPNLLAVHCRQNWGGQFIDVGITLESE